MWFIYEKKFAVICLFMKLCNEDKKILIDIIITKRLILKKSRLIIINENGFFVYPKESTKMDSF